MIALDTYINYFKHQAENHPLLAHSDSLGSRVFATITTEEALGDFRSGARSKGYIMRLLEYSYQVTDAGNHEVTKRHEGGFIIAHYHSSRDGGDTQYLEAVAKAERVVDDMIEKMIADSKAGHPLFYYSLDSRQDFIVTPARFIGDASYSGYLCLFSFNSFFRNCITAEDAPAWGDDGATPFDL